MKHIFFILFSHLCFNSYSQVSFPSSTDSPIWSMTFTTDLITTNGQVKLASDTVVCGKSWTAVRQIDSYFNTDEIIGYFREEGLKTYVKKNLSCDEEAFLMYDFGAQSGDTLWCGINLHIPQNNPAPILVLANEAINYNGILRTYILAEYRPDPLGLPIYLEWVEGVGDLTHPFYSLNCYSDFCGELQYNFHCMYVNGNLVFSDPNSFLECEYLIDTIYVNQALTTGGNNGFDWENAFFDLQDALLIADSSDVVLVAQGIYYPTNDDDREKSFVISNGVQMYGGFKGDEQYISDRDLLNYPTILSGNINNLNDSLDNSFHVLYGMGLGNTTIVDGLIIESGTADVDAISINNGNGGGFWIDTDSQHIYSNPIVKNCTFRKNYAINGGALYCDGIEGVPALEFVENCSFENNFAISNGGAIFKQGGGNNDTSTISNCSFFNNSSHKGGAIFLGDVLGSHNISNCAFVRDSSSFEGGAIAVETMISPLNLNFEKSEFVDNRSISGGGISIIYTGILPDNNDSLNCVIDSCTFENNAAILGVGAGIYIGNTGIKDNLSISNSLFKNNISFNAGAAIGYDNSEKGLSNIFINQCQFSTNSSINFPLGGALFYNGSGNGNTPIYNKSKITNSQFDNNGGAMAFFNGSLGVVEAEVVNCTFYQNGTLPIVKTWNENFDSISFYNNININNSIVWEDVSIESLFNNFDSPSNNGYTISNCLINVPSCEVNGHDPCDDGVIYQKDPLFLDPFEGNFQIKGCSPAINKGSNMFLPSSVIYDLGYNDRIQNGTVDIGAFEQDSFSVQILDVVEESCQDASDGEINVVSHGIFPFSINWFMQEEEGENIDSLSSGDYLLVVQDSVGCVDSINLSIGEIPPIFPYSSLQHASDFDSMDGSIQIDSISGGTSPFSFSWNTGDTTAVLDNLSPSTYSLTIIDSNGCEYYEDFIISSSSSLNEEITENYITLLPNPTKGHITISFQQIDGKRYTLDLFSTNGTLIKTWDIFSFGNDSKRLDLQDVSHGAYFLRVKESEGAVFYKKIIKQ